MMIPRTRTMTNPVVLELCQRLGSNDPTLTNLSFSALPLFEISVPETELILQALLDNGVVTHLDLSLPEQDTLQEDPSNVYALLKQVLVLSNCRIQSFTLTSGAERCWSQLCEALAQNNSITSLEIGTAASFFGQIFLPDSKFTLEACQQFALALHQSKVESFKLRRFHVDAQGWPWLVHGLQAMKFVELHQIVADSNLFHSLSELCRSLETLSIIECRSTSANVDYKTLTCGQVGGQAMSQLRTLRIVQCKSKNFGDTLCALPFGNLLAKLDLRDNSMDESAVLILAEWLAKQPSLEKISLEGCNLSDKSFSRILNALLAHQHLRRLNVRRNKIMGLPETSTILPRHLQALDISENKYLGDCDWLSRLVESNPHVKEWKLDSLTTTDKGLLSLCDAIRRQGQSSKIRVLGLQQTSMGIAGVTTLSKILQSNLTCLEELNVASCNLDDNAIAVLAPSLIGHESLVKLTLSFNPIGNESCRVLAVMAKHMPSLRSLDISFGKFDRNGLAHFIPTLQANPRVDSFKYGTYASFPGGKTDHVDKDISFWLSLNRAGRRVTSESVPHSVYPFVLQRAQRLGTTSALHYILRESVYLFEHSPLPSKR